MRKSITELNVGSASAEALTEIMHRLNLLEKSQDSMKKELENVKRELSSLKGNTFSPAREVRQPRYVTQANEHGYVQLGVSTPPVLLSKADYDDAFFASKTGKELTLKVIERVFTKQELSISNYRGGKVYSKSTTVDKPRLDTVRMSAILSQVNLEYPGFMEKPDDEKKVRDAINNKCRHTKC